MTEQHKFGKPVPVLQSENSRDVPPLDWTISKEAQERIERIERAGRWWWQL